MIFSIFLMIVIFSILVIAHELGHFLVARRNGVKVHEFGIGFPPRIFKIVKGGTVYSINLFPIGGFVRLKGEDPSEKGKDSFVSKSYKSKSKIILAGVGVNLLIAYLILYVLMVFGLPAILPSGFVNVGPVKPSRIEKSAPVVLSVSKDSAAQKVGLKIGDQINSLDGVNVQSTPQLQEITKRNAGKEIQLVYTSEGKQINTNVRLGEDSTKGYLGAAAQPIEVAYYNPFVAIIASGLAIAQLVLATLAAFGEFIIGLFTKAKVSENVAGPVGIASMFGVVTKFGWKFILAFTASISLSLAVINSLPLPALDGGRFALITLNRLGLKISPEKEAIVHWLGFVLLIMLIIIVTISDISRL